MELKSKTLADGSTARVAEIHVNGAWRFSVTVSQEDEGEWLELFASVDEAYWAYGLLTKFGPITERQAREAAEDVDPDVVWSIDLAGDRKEIESEIFEHLSEMDDAGELDYQGNDMVALAEFVADTGAWNVEGTFSQDDLDEAVRDAEDKYIGEDLEEYVGQLLDGEDNHIVKQYAGAIIDAMIHDMKCGGEISEYNGVWFRSC